MFVVRLSQGQTCTVVYVSWRLALVCWFGPGLVQFLPVKVSIQAVFSPRLVSFLSLCAESQSSPGEPQTSPTNANIHGSAHASSTTPPRPDRLTIVICRPPKPAIYPLNVVTLNEPRNLPPPLSSFQTASITIQLYTWLPLSIHCKTMSACAQTAGIRNISVQIWAALRNVHSSTSAALIIIWRSKN